MHLDGADTESVPLLSKDLFFSGKRDTTERAYHHVHNIPWAKFRKGQVLRKLRKYKGSNKRRKAVKKSLEVVVLRRLLPLSSKLTLDNAILGAR